MSSMRKKQVRFSAQQDTQLLREVLGKNPFADKNKWQEISESMSAVGNDVDVRRVRERTQLLIAQYKRQTTQSLKASGTDEIYDEKDVLLEEIVELVGEEEKRKTAKKNAEHVAKDIRKRAMESISSTKQSENAVEEELVVQKKPKNVSVVSFLKEKSESEFSIRKEELELRKQELEFEKEKFELEKQERLKRLETEGKEKAAMIELLMKLANK